MLIFYICNHEKQCAGNCIFGDVDFYEIEKELSIQYFDDLITYPTKLEERPIAIIGGGIAGLTLAHSLLKKGIKPTIYEKNHSKFFYYFCYNINYSSCNLK